MFIAAMALKGQEDYIKRKIQFDQRHWQWIFWMHSEHFTWIDYLLILPFSVLQA